VAKVAKRLAPKVSLGFLLLAPLLLDALWPLFLATGLESVRIDPGNTVVTPLDLHDYPYSHSLITSVGWSLAMAIGYRIVRPDRRGALVLAAGVFSHWILDFVTHRPDMPLYPGGSLLVGLGLWNSLPGTLVVETAMFVAGVAIYSRTTRARNRAGALSWWSLVGFLAVLYLGNVFGPPPPSVTAVVVAGFVGWGFVPWAAWIDRNREVVTARGSLPNLGS
jgi:membrane-bound metal-dependent hydrolase YbcI (DUF457 family)